MVSILCRNHLVFSIDHPCLHPQSTLDQDTPVVVAAAAAGGGDTPVAVGADGVAAALLVLGVVRSMILVPFSWILL